VRALPFTFASSDYSVLLAKISPSRWDIGAELKAKLCFCKSVIVLQVLTACSKVNEDISTDGHWDPNANTAVTVILDFS